MRHPKSQGKEREQKIIFTGMRIYTLKLKSQNATTGKPKKERERTI